jgi:hypothetical protein
MCMNAFDTATSLSFRLTKKKPPPKRQLGVIPVIPFSTVIERIAETVETVA